MKGDSGIILRIDTVEGDGSCIHVDPELSDPAYRAEFGKRVTLSLVDWRDRGLRIDAQLAPGVIAEYNASPYPDRPTADREYDKFKDSVVQKKYRIFSDNGNITARIVE